MIYLAFIFVGFLGIAVFIVLMIRDFVFVSDPTLLLLLFFANIPYFILLVVSIVFVLIGLYKFRVIRMRTN